MLREIVDLELFICYCW